MRVELLIFYGFSIMLITIYLDKPIEIVLIVNELLKILVSGYLGYLVRQIKDK